MSKLKLWYFIKFLKIHTSRPVCPREKSIKHLQSGYQKLQNYLLEIVTLNVFTNSQHIAVNDNLKIH